MRDDIVTRLRLRPTILRKDRFGDMETDRVATALFDDCHAIMREAADEIERLRAELVSKAHELARMTAERDEARRMFCDQSFGNKHAVACELGWSCYPETKR